MHEPTEVVREWKPQQHHIVRDDEVVQFIDDRDHREVVAVPDHASLGWARRAGRVDVGEQIVGLDPRTRVGQSIGMSGRVFATARA